MVWSHWGKTRPINKSSQWHLWKGLSAVWTLLHITMKPIIIVFIIAIIIGLILAQCDHTIIHEIGCWAPGCNEQIFFQEKNTLKATVYESN